MTASLWPTDCQFPLVPIRHSYDITLGKMLQTEPVDATDREVPYVKASSVQWTGVRVDPDLVMWASETERQALSLSEGDLLVCEGGDVGRSAVYTGPPGVILQNALHRVRGRDGARVDYLQHVLFAVHGSGYFDVLCNGATIRHLTGDKLGALRVPTPSVQDQSRIAAYLDESLESLDAMIADRQRQIALLAEQRDALVQDAFAPVREILPLRRVVDRWIDYRGSTPTKTTDGVPLVTAKNIRHGVITFDAAEEFIGADDYDSWMRRGLPESGDVLLTTEAPLGEVAQVLDTNIALAQRVILLRADRRKITDRWLYWFLRSPQGRHELRLCATGTTAQGIKAERLREVPIPVPSVEEQHEILPGIEAADAAFRTALPSLERSVALLTEHKHCVVWAAVTGQFDVTTARSVA